jgi:serine/threonine protein kinase
LAIVKIANRWLEFRWGRIFFKKYRHRYLSPPERFSREREILEVLAEHSLSARPLAATKIYLLMEFLEGAPVSDLLALDYRAAKRWWFEGFKGLRTLHSMGLPHGDARPDQVFVTDDGLKFIDFEHILDEGQFS